MMAKTGIRDIIKTISPPWLASGVAEKFLYTTLGLPVDGMTDNADLADRARMPGVGTPSALPLIGEDRSMPRGLGESDDSYAARLSRAFPTWRTAGSPHAVLRQILTYLQIVDLVRTVSNTGVWHTIEATAVADVNGDLPVDRYRARPNNWNWDGLTARWFRAWVIIDSSAGPWATDGTWDDPGTWDDGGTWDTTATPEEVSTIRMLVGKWKAQHAVVPWIVIMFDNAWFVPTLPSGDAHLPDGQWGPWSKDDAGNRVASRTHSASYWDGTTDGND